MAEYIFILNLETYQQLSVHSSFNWLVQQYKLTIANIYISPDWPFCHQALLFQVLLKVRMVAESGRLMAALLLDDREQPGHDREQPGHDGCFLGEESGGIWKLTWWENVWLRNLGLTGKFSKSRPNDLDSRTNLFTLTRFSPTLSSEKILDARSGSMYRPFSCKSSRHLLIC